MTIDERRKELAALKANRTSWDAHWLEIGEYMLPRRPRFLVTDANSGRKRNDKILHEAAIKALRTLSSGMTAGITSPARPWFRLTTPDPDLMKRESVRDWLWQVEERIRLVLHMSNFYHAAPTLYRDLGAFGVSALQADESFGADVIRCYVHPIGSYWLASDAEFRIQTIYRQSRATVAQIVERFGENGEPTEAMPDLVKSAWRDQRYHDSFTLYNAIGPNRDRDPERGDAKGKPWASVWFMDGARDFLQVSGFWEFPCMAPRWEVTGEDVYGSSPGMDVLGSVKLLQKLESKGLSALNKIVDPPMVGPSVLRSGGASIVPGTITYLDTVGPGVEFKPAHQVDAKVVFLQEKVRDVVQRINAGFFADLWLMLHAADNPQMTAREVAERHEEKMLQLGPVLEGLHDEFLDPLIGRVYAILERRGYLPPPPPDIQGRDFQPEYISILAQAQKMLGLSGLERTTSYVIAAANVNPEALDVWDFDEAIRLYGDLAGIAPRLIRSKEDVEEARAARAQQQQMAQLAALAKPASDAAAAARSIADIGDGAGAEALARTASPVAAGGV